MYIHTYIHVVCYALALHPLIHAVNGVHKMNAKVMYALSIYCYGSICNLPRARLVEVALHWWCEGGMLPYPWLSCIRKTVYTQEVG